MREVVGWKKGEESCGDGGVCFCDELSNGDMLVGFYPSWNEEGENFDDEACIVA